METLKYRVEKEELGNPVCIRTFKKDKIGGSAAVKEADALKQYLEMLGLKFAVIESESEIEIFIEATSLREE